MATLHRERNWKIAIYGREHGAPHFHVEGPGFPCSVAIATLEVIVGAAPPAVLLVATAWAEDRREALMARWSELNP